MTKQNVLGWPSSKRIVRPLVKRFQSKMATGKMEATKLAMTKQKRMGKQLSEEPSKAQFVERCLFVTRTSHKETVVMRNVARKDRTVLFAFQKTVTVRRSPAIHDVILSGGDEPLKNIKLFKFDSFWLAFPLLANFNERTQLWWSSSTYLSWRFMCNTLKTAFILQAVRGGGTPRHCCFPFRPPPIRRWGSSPRRKSKVGKNELLDIKAGPYPEKNSGKAFFCSSGYIFFTSVVFQKNAAPKSQKKQKFVAILRKKDNFCHFGVKF